VRGAGASAFWLASLALTLVASLRADEAALTVADLAAYRAALSPTPGANGDATPPKAASFRELWEHPEVYRGRRVEVQGRVVRRFRQGAMGTFPALEEAWAFSSPTGNPFCLVFPVTAKPDPGPSGTSPKTRTPDEVRFVGTFLKLVQYQGADGPRLAPLIVGPASPAAAAAAPAAATSDDRGPRPAAVPANGLTGLGGTIALVAALLVALVLARQHMRRPLPLPSRRRHSRGDAGVGPDPEPLFDDAPAPRSPEG
jgi:hypothetical protein